MKQFQERYDSAGNLLAICLTTLNVMDALAFLDLSSRDGVRGNQLAISPDTFANAFGVNTVLA